MSRLTFNVSQDYAATSVVEKSANEGRRVRQVANVIVEPEQPERSVLFHPLFLKILAGLAIIAIVALSSAVWRLFHFPH